MKHLGTVQAALAATIVAGFFGVIGLLIFHPGETGMRDALLILVGALGAAFGAVIQFYFGSSSGSAKKDQLLADRAATGGTST